MSEAAIQAFPIDSPDGRTICRCSPQSGSNEVFELIVVHHSPFRIFDAGHQLRDGNRIKGPIRGIQSTWQSTRK